MDSRLQFSILAAIALCLFLHFPSNSEAASPIDLLSRVCKQSENLKSCVEVLKSNPEVASATNIRDVANAALELARKETQSFGDFINGLLNDKATDPAHKPSLKTCADYITSSLPVFSLRGLEDGSASLDVHYALDNVESCERALASGHVHVPPVAARTQKWKTIYSAAYASVVALEG